MLTPLPKARVYVSTSYDIQTVQEPYRFSLKQTFAVDQVEKSIVPIDEIVKEINCVEWKIVSNNNGEGINFELTFNPQCCYNEKFHSVDVEWESVLLKNNGTYEHRKHVETKLSLEKEASFIPLIRWTDVDNYIINGKITVEYHVKVIRIGGIPFKVINFEKPVEKFSDAILIIANEDFNHGFGPVISEVQLKYHVNKALLAYHSTYFKSLFTEQLGRNCFDVGQKVGPNEFQVFLDVLHGEPALNDRNITAVLRLAKMFGTPMVFRQCEHYLMKISKLGLKEKFDLALKHDFENLKNDCIENMRTPEDVQNVMPSNIEGMDHFLITSLLKKAASFKTSSK